LVVVVVVTVVVRMHVDGRRPTRRLDSQAAMPYGAVATKAMRVPLTETWRDSGRVGDILYLHN
jgi:hypothetical protein